MGMSWGLTFKGDPAFGSRAGDPTFFQAAHAGLHNHLCGSLSVPWRKKKKKKKVGHRPAAKGWIALNVSPHDIPIDQPPDYYEQQLQTALKDYWTIGNDNRDTSYFLQCISVAAGRHNIWTNRRIGTGKCF